MVTKMHAKNQLLSGSSSESLINVDIVFFFIRRRRSWDNLREEKLRIHAIPPPLLMFNRSTLLFMPIAFLSTYIFYHYYRTTLKISYATTEEKKKTLQKKILKENDQFVHVGKRSSA